MQAFATSPSSFKKMALQSLQNWFPSFKLIWPLIIPLVLIRQYYCPSCSAPNPEHWMTQLIVAFLMIMIDITLWVAISVAIYRSFQLQRDAFWQHLLPMFKRCFSLLVALFLYSFFVSFAGFLGYLIGGQLVHNVTADSSLLKMVPILIGTPMLYVLVLLLFTLPMLVIDNLSVWQAFKHSASMTGPRWFRAFFAYAALLSFVGILSGIYSLEYKFGSGFFVNFAIDFISFLVLVPLFANFYVLVLHDLKLRTS